ncbi:MAG: hypothetical protein J1E41_05310, partial [Ruminococcus sp.]|nr:hypothetical protein [Ruminococcus sp.]
SDDVIFSIQDVITLNDEEITDNKFLHFATYNEDYFYLNCDGSAMNIYYSEEGIGEIKELNMSLVAFLEASLISGFSYFWLWGTKDFDLY